MSTLVKQLKSPLISKRFEQILNKDAGGFVASIISIANSNLNLAKCDPQTVINAAMKAAALKLPIEPSLGFAYIIPYKNQAQFQIGYKGFIQLAQRSGQLKKINVIQIYKGQLLSADELKEVFELDYSISGGPVVGYLGYMELINGFSKTVYWDTEKMKTHGLKYSQSFKKKFGLWVDEFDKMATKTMIKYLLSKYAPMSTEMQEAVRFDQSVIIDDETPEYVDEFADIKDFEDDKPQARILDNKEGGAK